MKLVAVVLIWFAYNSFPKKKEKEVSIKDSENQVKLMQQANALEV